jgi:predicted nucleotidyltransferase
VNFSVRFVLEASEVPEKYGRRTYRPLGTASLRCTIADDSLSILTPCWYGVTDVEFIEGPSGASLIEIVSYRAKFAEYATEGERVFARGRLEEVIEGDRRWLRLVLTGGGDTMYVVRQST